MFTTFREESPNHDRFIRYPAVDEVRTISVYLDRIVGRYRDHRVVDFDLVTVAQ